QHKLKVGDIVFGRRGEMGRCAMVTENEIDWLCGTGGLNVRLSNRAMPEFVSIYLGTSYVRELLKLESVGSTMDNLNTQILSRVSVPLPPLDEQQAIVTFLDNEIAKFDTLTTEANRAISLLQERRSALISAAVTGKIDVRNT
ncbi:MAG: restriction endonuclease subunit S, partial [Sulfurimicrobium sp.]|nr:restriction endonuclease subunit S [Sulfurimicrobium sp.]